MQNEKKNIPERLIERLNYKLLRYGTIYNIKEKDTLIFNYVLSRSKKTGKQDTDGKDTYINQQIQLDKIEDIAYIKSLIYKLIGRRTETEIKTGNPEERRSHFYYAKKIKGANKKLNSYYLSKEYFDKKENVKKRTDDTKCVFPLVEIPIVLNMLEEINIKTTFFYKGEKRKKDTFYNVESDNGVPPEGQGEFIDEQMDDEIPF